MIGFRTFMIAAAGVGLAGCMLSPTDDGRVGSTNDLLPFQGYVTEPNVPVQIRAWDYTAHAMASAGMPVLSTTTETTLSDGSLYFWSAPRALQGRFWRTGPAGGQCAAVGAQTTIDGSTYNVITVESSWGSCFNNNPTIGGFYANCRSDHSPVALLYTNSWGSLTVDQSRLNLAGVIASGQITLTLDNFTPVQGQFCNSGNPTGCPPGLSADPETYQFFAPNASSLTQAGQPPLTFSITPARSDPMTVYIDNMSSRSIDFTTSGDKFVLGINFETAQPEIQMNCIRNAACLFVGNPALELDTPRAAISFSLAVQAGRVVYTNATAVFTTSSTDGRAVSAASGISAAMTDKLNNEPAIKAAVATAIDSVIRQSAGLGTLPLDGLTIGGGTIQVRPGCPMD